MLNFENSRQEALDYIRKCYSARVLEMQEINALDFSKFGEVWEVVAELFLVNDIARSIAFHVAFPTEFPLVLPKIYLTYIDKAWIQYIPHVTSIGYVCLYDDESITLVTSKPGEIVEACINRAIYIVGEGLRKKNLAEFKEEFIAYWEDSYGKGDKIFAGLSMIDDSFNQQSEIEILRLHSDFRAYQLIIHNQSNEAKHFAAFLKRHGTNYDEIKGLYLGEVSDIEPPFRWTNENVFSIVKEHFPNKVSDYIKYIRSKGSSLIFIFSIRYDNSFLFLGWQIQKMNLQRKGFRNVQPEDAYFKFQKNDSVSRLRFEEYSKKRLKNRTDGEAANTKSLSISMVGLGSIGSNLVPYIMSLNITKINFIDPDILTLENINRHLLGIDYLKLNKANALHQSISLKDPLIDNEYFEQSVISIINNSPEVLNNTDYLFLAVGKTNIEEYVVAAGNEGILTKPVFILWVEPYLIGGHCLFIPPSSINYNDLFVDGLFKYNIIHSDEYDSVERHLLFREAGCQSSFVPYGKKNITLFLSRIIPEVYKIIDDNRKETVLLSWKGNDKIVESLKISLSEYSKCFTEDNLNIIPLQ